MLHHAPLVLRPVRRAFTLIELLVVIAIIAVLMGLLVPAVQKVRESASRMKCSNNLKQLGLALHNYHDVHHRLPPADVRVGTSFAYPSWAVRVLPYLEQDALFREFTAPLAGVKQNDGYNPADKLPAAVVATPLPVFFCPSRRAPPADVVAQAAGTVPAGAAGDYGVCVGDDNFQSGAFPLASGTTHRLTDVTDGLSSTLLVGEKHLPLPASNFGTSAASDLCIYASDHGTVGRQAGPRFPLGLSPTDTSTMPNPMNFGSWHAGLVQFVFCDGSVHALSPGTSGTALGYLANIADGQVISSD